MLKVSAVKMGKFKNLARRLLNRMLSTANANANTNATNGAANANDAVDTANSDYDNVNNNNTCYENNAWLATEIAQNEANERRLISSTTAEMAPSAPPLNLAAATATALSPAVGAAATTTVCIETNAGCFYWHVVM